MLKDGFGNAIPSATWSMNFSEEEYNQFKNGGYAMKTDNIPNITSGNLDITWTYSDGSSENQTVAVTFNAK